MASPRLSVALRRLGLAVSGLLVLALTAAVGLAGTLTGPPTSRELELEPMSVGAGPTTWVCAPAPTLPTAAAGEDVEYDPDLGTGGGAVATLADLTAIGTVETPSMTVTPLSEDAEGIAAGTAGALATLSQPEITDPVVGVVEPFEEGVPLVGGASVARADAGDLRGLSATACQQPVSSAVLVGGSTELGASARLVLSNPGETAASVSLTGWGATGQLPEIAPMVVPAGGVRTLLLESISLEPRLAIRIDVEGGRVVPSIQDSSLDGLIAAGTEIVGPAADPTTELTIAGALLPDDDDASALLRLVNPGLDAATVQVEMLGPDGAEVLPGAEASVIEPGTVADISLAGLPSGRYGVRVTSDVPVTGAVQMSRTGTAGEDDPDTPPVDIAWLPASSPVDAGVLTLPTDLVDTVNLSATNPGTADVEVTVRAYDAAGEVIQDEPITVPAGATRPITVPDGTLAVVLEGDGILASAVVGADAADGALIAAYPITGDPYTEQSVTVRVSN